MSTQNRLFTAMTPIFCSLTYTKQSLQYTIKITSRWSSTAQVRSKYKLYTYKASQLHGTVQQKCYCKISYLTTFDNYDPEAISQWCDTFINSAYLRWWEASNPSAVSGGLICIRSINNRKYTAFLR